MRTALAILSGALLALSFPQFGHPAFAWVALVPLLLGIERMRSWPSAFQLGLVAGVVHFAGTVYWIGDVMVAYGGLARPVAWLVTALLVAYLALFPAAFAVGMVMVRPAGGQMALLWAPAIWVATELGRLHLLGGFPWELLGYSQTFVTPIAQLASVFGVYGISALVVFVNVCIALAVVASGRVRGLAISAAAVAVTVTAALGSARVRDGGMLRAGEPLKVGLLQGNIAQDLKWDPGMRRTILDRYLGLARQAATSGAELVVWPESATPVSFDRDLMAQEEIRQLSRETGASQLVGTTEVEPGTPAAYYNSAFLLDTRGDTAGVYRKIRLVPFGEYVPLKGILFFVAPLVETVADFSPGQSQEPLPVNGSRVSTAICYEIIYPGLIRQFVLRGSQLLTAITNDAWYGTSSAPYQHFQQAAMRAIEQGRYLVRAANTGISGIVDPYGRVVASTPLFETRVVTGEVRMLSTLTVYGRIGDVFAYACLAMTAAVLLGVASTRRRPPGR